ncbi:MAG: ATP phosphoribosyltransferase regulatory subunit [Bauldia sp.]
MTAAYDAIRAVLAGAGYAFVEPPILQDADIFLDLAGEDLRRRLFLTPSADGVELCLRPDYTIPVALHHLTSGNARRVANYAYLGPVFRQRAGETGEFAQAGVESIGRGDTEAADADVLSLAIAAAEAAGVRAPKVKLGDSALFLAVLDALAIPAIWRRRLARAFGDRARLDAAIDRLAKGESAGAPGYAGFRGALDGVDGAKARQLVDDLLAIAGITAVGGRSAAEIAERFAAQAALAAESGVSPRALAVLKRFLAISGSPDEAAVALTMLATQENLDIAAALRRFDVRNALIAKAGLKGSLGGRAYEGRVTFAADFGRRLDYYTGFVFEVDDATRHPAGAIVGGGRYDRLISRIVERDGSGADIPAVGFALWLDRLAKRGRA